MPLAVKWHIWHIKFSHAIVTGFRFRVPSMIEKIAVLFLPLDPHFEVADLLGKERLRYGLLL